MNEQIEKGKENTPTEANDKKQNKDSNGDAANENEPQPNRTLWENIKHYIKNFKRYLLIEPFLIFYIFPGTIAGSTLYKLNLEKACRANLGHTVETCMNVITGNLTNNITMEASTQSRILVAEMTAWNKPLQSSLPAILILFLGAWSDRTGNRKALMLAPVIGELVSNFLLLLATYYFTEWPLWATGLIEGLPTALSGGTSVALMGAFSHLADIVPEEERTFRMGIVGVLVTLSFPIGSSISGILTEAIGYYGIFSICVVMYIFGFLYTYLRIHNVKKVKSDGTIMDKIIEFFHPRNVWDTISLVIMARGRTLAQILLVISAHIIILGPVYGEGGLFYLYTLGKYQMKIEEFSFFTSYMVIMGLCGTAIAVTLFSKKLKMHDALLGIIATTSKVLSSIMYGVAPTKGWLYSAPVIDIFGSSAMPAIRSLGTKIVKPDQIGKICSVIGLCEAIVPVIYVPIYSDLYKRTIEAFPGAFYLLGSIMTAPDFAVFTALYILHKRNQKDVVKNPETKESHAYENTAL